MAFYIVCPFQYTLHVHFLNKKQFLKTQTKHKIMTCIYSAKPVQYMPIFLVTLKDIKAPITHKPAFIYLAFVPAFQCQINNNNLGYFGKVSEQAEVQFKVVWLID